jgi:hypothetical protein
LQIKTKIVSRHTADFKPVKQEVNSTAILPPLVFPGLSMGSNTLFTGQRGRERDRETDREREKRERRRERERERERCPELFF